MPEDVKNEAMRELNRLARMSPASPEYGVTRTYLDWMAALPVERIFGLAGGCASGAAEILDEDHYDLEKVKERILDYLAVLQLKPVLKGPILCFVGPPGVGKTSLGNSIARALDRKFARMSMGGMHDEAEIRGHRRTYIGALPGQIIQALRRAGVNDPVFMLDEVDKLGRDFRGDPASALLEVLDPEQNITFPRQLPGRAVRSFARSCSSRPPMCSIPCPMRCATAWRLSRSKAIPKTRR